MGNFDLQSLLRENIKQLQPYSSARNEFKGSASIYLDANENAFGSPLPMNYNRYPDPLQIELKEKLSGIKGVPVENTFIGNGSDEAIDLLIRAFCRPQVDNIMILPPTYGMYEVSAQINDIAIKRVPLTPNHQLDLDGIAEQIDPNTKIIFICSPNNPTGNSMYRDDIETLLANFNGLVVVDEAYINFSRQKSFIQELTEYENLLVMQTLSKAWGLASLRIGMAFASAEVIGILNKIKPPYNINQASLDLACQALERVEQVNDWIRVCVSERERLGRALSDLAIVQRVFPSDANFLLVQFEQAELLYNYLRGESIVVRDRSRVILCENCLRITVGTPEENSRLLSTLEKYQDGQD